MCVWVWKIADSRPLSIEVESRADVCRVIPLDILIFTSGHFLRIFALASYHFFFSIESWLRLSPAARWDVPDGADCHRCFGGSGGTK